MPMKTIFKDLRTGWQGILVCLLIAVPSHFLGRLFPVIGGPVIAIVAGMLISLVWKDHGVCAPGIRFTGKKVLQWAVVLLGFGLNLSVVLQTGAQSLPIILCTISVSLVIAYALHRVLKVPGIISTLVGVGSSICGGSAIAATASVIDADDEAVAQAISVIFLFNVLAAIIFPYLGQALGFSMVSGDGFGLFAGTAVNDTSSVTACAATWDSMFGLGSATLDKAVTVKLTRTLAIIPITLALAFLRTRGQKDVGRKISLRKIFPFFILWFIAASVATTLCTALGMPESSFALFKSLSKFLIILAMAAIGLNTDLVKLVKTGGKPILMGACCWIGIILVSLIMIPR